MEVLIFEIPYPHSADYQVPLEENIPLVERQWLRPYTTPVSVLGRQAEEYRPKSVLSPWRFESESTVVKMARSRCCTSTFSHLLRLSVFLEAQRRAEPISKEFY
jgi:hypothetical protein